MIVLLQVIASTVVFINAFHLMPLLPGDNSIQQVRQPFGLLDSHHCKPHASGPPV